MHIIEISRKHFSWLLILEDIDHFNPMRAILFPIIKSYDVSLRTHYSPLLYMTMVSYIANTKVSNIGVPSYWTLCLESGYQKGQYWELIFSTTLLSKPNFLNSLYGFLFCIKQYYRSVLVFLYLCILISSLIFWVSVAACSMNINHCLFTASTSSYGARAGLCQKMPDGT